jgi:hypothetical protein
MWNLTKHNYAKALYMRAVETPKCEGEDVRVRVRNGDFSFA